MKTISKNYAILIIIGLILSLQSSCKKDENEEPKPITVENLMNPTTAAHGATIQWEVKITNLGEAIEITRVHAKFICSKGWAKNQVLQDLDLPIASGSFSALESKTVFSSPVITLNSGTTNVEITNTVTAYFDGGSVSDVIVYKIYNAPTKIGKFTINTIIGN